MAEMFGGLDLCSLEALVARDGTEVIIEVNDCAMGLLGESQEEDRRNIAEVIVQIYVCFSIMMQTSAHFYFAWLFLLLKHRIFCTNQKVIFLKVFSMV